MHSKQKYANCLIFSKVTSICEMEEMEWIDLELEMLLFPSRPMVYIFKLSYSQADLLSTSVASMGQSNTSGSNLVLRSIKK